MQHQASVLRLTKMKDTLGKKEFEGKKIKKKYII